MVMTVNQINHPGCNHHSCGEFLEVEERKMTSFPMASLFFKDAGDEGGLAAHPWPAKKREDSVGWKVKTC